MSLNVKRWNQLRIAFWGAIFGGAYIGISATIEGPHPAGELIGEILGGAMGAALLFGL